MQVAQADAFRQAHLPAPPMTERPLQVLQRLFKALHRNDPEAIRVEMGSDIAMVDEISRRWLLGLEPVSAQIQAVVPGTTGLSSAVKALHTQLPGSDAVGVTGWLDQSSTLDGQT